jgi:hypothetical protein
MLDREERRVRLLDASRPWFSAIHGEQATLRVVAGPQPRDRDDDQPEPGDDRDERDRLRHMAIVAPLSSGGTTVSSRSGGVGPVGERDGRMAAVASSGAIGVDDRDRQGDERDGGDDERDEEGHRFDSN